VRADALDARTAGKVGKSLEKAEKLEGLGETDSAIDLLDTAIRQLEDPALSQLKQALIDLRDSLD
jgi:hypothetical protein